MHLLQRLRRYSMSRSCCRMGICSGLILTTNKPEHPAHLRYQHTRSNEISMFRRACGEHPILKTVIYIVYIAGTSSRTSVFCNGDVGDINTHAVDMHRNGGLYYETPISASCACSLSADPACSRRETFVNTLFNTIENRLHFQQQDKIPSTDIIGPFIRQFMLR